ncbi:MAG TPA: YihY/virulence factor BrkB family protein [Candidatus Binatia bacterium]|nr:YihY/virulence factor BrkB family protein [Candidatus Binatia bacterium]
MSKQDTVDDGARGRQARRPSEIPRRGWWDIAVRVRNEIAEDNLSIIAAGVAFYAFLAIFPALAALVSIYGLVTDPADLEQQIRGIERVLPAEAANLLNSELRRIVDAQGNQLGWGLAGGIVLALWSAASGMKALFQSMNITYDEEEKRGFLKLNAMAISMTLSGVLFVIFFLLLIVGAPALLANFPIGEVGSKLIDYARWPLLAVCGIIGLGLLYRYGPSRDRAQWRWISWGSVIATLIWLAGSFLFSYYVTNFGNYNKTYGSLGVVVILMIWFLLAAYSILLGAEINAEMEPQTSKDTTVDEERPMGDRGAYVADTAGRRSDESHRDIRR